MSKQGLIEFRVSPAAFIFSKIGLRNFESNSLHDNFDALMLSLIEKKPESIKGRYFMKGMVKTTLGPIYHVDLTKYSSIIN